MDRGDVLDVVDIAETLGGMIDKTWNPRTTTGRVSDDNSLGITRIDRADIVYGLKTRGLSLRLC